MKKIIVIMMALMLCACSSGLKWDDVQDKYAAMAESVENIAESAKEFTKKDYTALLEEISSGIEAIQPGVGKNDTAAVDALYESALKLEKIVSAFSNDSSSQLSGLVQTVKDLVTAAYNKSEGFEDMRTDAKGRLETIMNWTDEMWLPVEKHATIAWDDVKESYEAFAKEVIANMTRNRDVTEQQLVELKDFITENYEGIMYGVTEKNEDLAKELYSAALQLQEYTKDMNGEAAEKVNEFATHAIQYIMNAYGVKIEDETYDFLNEAENAKKWTLSLWNEIVARLAQDNLYEFDN